MTRARIVSHVLIAWMIDVASKREIVNRNRWGAVFFMTCSRNMVKGFCIFSCLYHNRETFQSCEFLVNCM